MKHRALFALLGLLACMLALSACGSDDDGAGDGSGGVRSPNLIRRHAANERTTIRVGSKNFTEQKVLGEIYAQGLEAAGYKITRELDLGDEHAAQKALTGGLIDGYPEYTGTALSSLCGVAADRVPKDPTAAYEDAKRCLADKGQTAFPPGPFTSSNEVAVTRKVAT